MKLNRREFLVGSAAIALLPAPAIAAPRRAPFVEVGSTCDFLYFEDWERPSQPNTISSFVEHIAAWNGDAYPIVLAARHLGQYGIEYWDGIDSEWCLFRKEVPEFSWKDHEGRYPNIHAYVREKRFGEDPRAIAAQMERNRLFGRLSPTPRGEVLTRKSLFPATKVSNGGDHG